MEIHLSRLESKKMPDWNEILEELKETEHDLRSKAKGSYDVVRRRYLSNLHDITGRNVIIYYSGWLQRGDLPKTAINDEDKNGFMTVFHNLDHTKGIYLKNNLRFWYGIQFLISMI